MVVLSAIFTTALNGQVASLHPCKGVRTPPVPAQPRSIISRAQFAVLYECHPDPQSKLLVETDAENGLPWSSPPACAGRSSRCIRSSTPEADPKDTEYGRFKLNV